MKDKNKRKKESASREKKKTDDKLHTINENNHIKNHFPEFTRDILDSSAVGIFILDSDFKIAWINHATEKYFGLDREKVLGKDKRELIKKNIQHIFEDPDEFTRKVFATYDNNTYIENFECHVLSANKRKDRYLEHWSQPIKTGIYKGGRIEYYHDISNLKQAEKQLKDSEEWLKILFNYAPDAYYIHDLKGNFIDVNRQAEKLIGYKKEELIGKNFFELKLLSTKDMPKVEKSFTKTNMGLPTGPDEYVLKRKDKSTVVVEISDHLVKIKGKKCVLGIARDITERKQIEKTLTESEEKYHTVFENTGTAMVIIDEDNNISMVNAQFEKLSGYTKAEIENKRKWIDFIVPEDLERMKKYHLTRRKPGEEPPTKYEFRIIDKKGAIKDIFTKIGMIPNTKKSVASLTDITERKEAENKLRESERKLKEAQHIAQVGSWEYDFSKDMLHRSDEVYRIFNLKPQQFGATYKSFLDNIHPDDRAMVDKAYTESVKNKKPYDIIHRLLLKDSTLKFVRERCETFYNDTSKTFQSIGTIQDITERIEAEQKLLHRVELEKLITSISTRFVGISLDKIDDEINRMLQTVGQFTHIDRSYLFLFSEDGSIMDNTHEWCAPGVEAQIDNLQGFPSSTFPWWMEKLNRNETIHTPRVDELPSHAQSEKEILQSQNIQSVLVVPVAKGSKLIGFIGFDTVKQIKNWTKEDITLLKTLSNIVAQTLERRKAEERLQKAMNATIETMSKIVEAKDPYTSGHQHRVCQLAVHLARELNLPEDKIEGIRIASLIHDIGKIGLPTEILSKPTTLTDIEFSLIKAHSQIGYDILKTIDFNCPVAQIVLQHHEKINGSGYPKKLKSDEILPEAKILGVADVVEAMSSHRPYRPALGIDAALEEISKTKGILYEPEVVAACFKLFKEKGFKFE